MQTRDFIDVRDITAACVLAMNEKKADYDFFNIGTGRAITIKEVAETLIKLYGKKVTPKIENRFRAGDIRHCYSDIEKIKKIGFNPKVNLEEGLKNLVKWGEKEEAVDKIELADKELERRKLKL